MTQAIERKGDHLELVALEGQQLSAVTFVQDYVQLHFDGPMITAITRPIVVAGDGSRAFGAPGYRDQLCGLISESVTIAYVRVGECLQIDFRNSMSLVVSLKSDAYRAAEAVIFSDGKGDKWAVW